MIFIAVVDKDPDTAYGIRFPDLPGCFSASDNQGDIISNAQEALRCHLDGRQSPAPSDLEEIRELAADDITNGCLLLAVPFTF